MRPIYICPKENKEDEIFIPLHYPGVKDGMYIISNYGVIKNCFTGATKSNHYDKDGYARVSLAISDDLKEQKGRGDKCFSVHKLVAYSFVPNYDTVNNNVVNHMDTKITNNYYGNLEHCTDSYNREHAKRNYCFSHGKQNTASKYSEEQVREICELFEQGMTPIEVLRNFGIHSSKDDKSFYDLLRNIYDHKTWKHISKDYNF